MQYNYRPVVLATNRPRTVALLGTSITAQTVNVTGTTINNAAVGYWGWANAAARQPLRTVANPQGAIGTTTAVMASRMGAEVLSLNPGYCILELGPNDARSGVPTATTNANMTQMIQSLLAANIVPIVCAGEPCSEAAYLAANAALQQASNQFLKRYCQDQGVPFVDWFPYLSDPASAVGAWAAGMTTDLVHPNPAGAKAMGAALAPVLSGLFSPVTDRLPTSNADAGNLLPNGMLTGNAAGLATGGWSVATGDGGGFTTTNTKVARTDGVQGEWQRIQATLGNYRLQQVATAGFTPGRSYYGSIEFRTFAAPTAEGLFSLQVLFMAGAAVVNTLNDLAIVGGETYGIGYHPAAGVLRTPPFVLPVGAGITQIQLRAFGGGLATTDWARAEVREVVP